MEVIRMEVGKVEVDCVEFWACHCFYVVVGKTDKYWVFKGGYWLCGILGLPLLLFGSQSIRIGAGSFHWGDLSGGFCGLGVERWDWQVDFGIMLAAFGCWVLTDFVSEEILAIAITTLIPLVFLLSMYCLCLCNDDIKSEHAHNSHTGGGGESM